MIVASLTCVCIIVTLYHEGDSDSETIALSSDDESDDHVENEKVLTYHTQP